MDDFINVIKRNPKAQIKIRDVSDKFSRLLYNYQSIKGYDTLIQNVNFEGMINLVGTITVEIDIEIIMKIKRLKYLESRLL